MGVDSEMGHIKHLMTAILTGAVVLALYIFLSSILSWNEQSDN